MFENTKWYFKTLNREYKSAYTQNNFFRNPFKEKKNNSLVLKVAKAYLLLAEKNRTATFEKERS